MDVVLLSRLQFAAATAFHFIFVPLTLGLSLIIALMETKYVRTGDVTYQRMAKFWGKMFLINFAIGIVTGITLEFQFGTNWSRYSQYVGDVFGSLLAIEATAAFFLESTFIAVWAFGWKKLSAKMHALTIWLVTIASSVSSIWIIIANSWMQHPVGYTIRNGRAEMTDFMAIVTQKLAWMTIAHTLFGAFIFAGFFVMGISAYHLLRKQHLDVFRKSFRFGLVFTTIFAFAIVVQGHFHGENVYHQQPAKLAAMESLWETTESAPMYLLTVPDEKNERNKVDLLPIPGLMSLLATGSADAELKGLKDFPKDERPPVALVFYAFRLMVACGMFFLLLVAVGWLLGDKVETKPLYLKLLILAIPLPNIAIQAGWIVKEVGRQPWIVYGVMKTSEAVSPVPAVNVAISLAAFILVYSLLGAAAIFLIYKAAVNGPVPLPADAKTADSKGGR